MTDQELRDLVGSLAKGNIEIQAQQKRMAEEIQAQQKRMAEEILASRQENDRVMRQVNKQIGEIGNKWGTFAEGMALASIKRILMERFGIEIVSENTYRRKGGDSIEIDVFGYANGSQNTAVCVEIKSHLREDGIDQLLETLDKFPQFLPDHADKNLFGLIACIHVPDSLKKVLHKKGIYLATLNEDVFELNDFPNFQAHNFKAN